MGDISDELQESILGARREGQWLSIVGAGSKSFLTRPGTGIRDSRLLSTAEHAGIVEYRPDELVVTVRTGTPLKELGQVLAREGQMLGFEPPEYHGLGTVGGALAAGIAGPGRPDRGGVRDAVLGVKMINGLGEQLTFGGQVMKNVAGFDVSRLQAGAYGMLGLLLEVSFKVVPQPQTEQTVRLEMTAAEAHAQMRKWAAEPHPITATAWLEEGLWVRLSGAEAAVNQTAAAVGGERQPDNGFWRSLKDHTLSLFRTGNLACRHLAPGTPPADVDHLIEWHGARRWSIATNVPEGFQSFATGYARHRCRDGGGDLQIAAYQARLKDAFDPDHLFNPELTDADVAA
jgi:glycolate oxidase FAD binding subunit